MYERFTDRARTVMQLANGMAHGFCYEYITSEHILLGLLQEGSGLAVHALKNLDVDPGKLWLEIEKIVPRGPYKFSRDKLPQTPCVKQIIADAHEEAELLDHNYVGTEHLLLALIRQKESVAEQVLMDLGLKLEDVREEVLRLLGRKIPAEEDYSGRTVVRRWSKASRSQDGTPEKKCSEPPQGETPPSVERERIRSLERQLWNVRIVLGALTGALAGVLLAAQLGAVLGLILGGVMAAIGWRIPVALTGGVSGALLGSAHLTSEGGGLGGALLGALAGILIAEIGGPSDHRGFANLWRRK